jgi:CRP/FNR family cyclic AMP-dependent transcriptional regulator
MIRGNADEKWGVMRNRVARDELDMLAEVPLFSGCSQTELRAIARLGTPVPIDTGRVLMRKGEVGSEFYLVRQGTASCNVGRRHVTNFGPGDFFGEMALLEGGLRTATITALEPMEVIVLHKSEFRDLLMASPSISLKLLSNLAARLRDADAAMTS